MRKILLFAVAALAATMITCDSAPNGCTQGEPWLRHLDLGRTGVGDTHCWVVPGIALCPEDMARPPDMAEPAPYNACVVASVAQVMSGSAQAQQCLTQRTCLDSNGVSYVASVWDSCHGYRCRWVTSCRDNVSYCAPDNQQSGPEYADDQCSIPIALVPTSGGKPAFPFVGFLKPTDGGDHCVDYYEVRGPFSGDFDYYLSHGSCLPEELVFGSLGFWYIGSQPVDPAQYFVPR